jgi:hypothetical protein
MKRKNQTATTNQPHHLNLTGVVRKMDTQGKILEDKGDERLRGLTAVAKLCLVADD